MKLSLELPKEFLDLCETYKADPEEVIKGFVADLAGIQNWAYPNPEEGRNPRPKDGYQSNGSDERRLAMEYFHRVGYPYR
jgi:hypothetical protein